MAPHRITRVTITADYDPNLDETQQHAVADALAAFLPGDRGLMTSSPDGPTTWQTIVDDTMTVQWWTERAHLATRDTLPAGPHEVLAIEVVTAAEFTRRHNAPLTVSTAPLTDDERARAAHLRAHPTAISTAEFAELLGCTPARVRQLRARTNALVDAGGFPDDGFPLEVAEGSGYWWRAHAEAYAARPRPSTGRPRIADRTDDVDQVVALLNAAGKSWREMVPELGHTTNLTGTTEHDGDPITRDTVLLSNGSRVYLIDDPSEGDPYWNVLGWSNASKARWRRSGSQGRVPAAVDELGEDR